MPVFAVSRASGLLVGVLVSFVLALLAVALVLAVKPDAPAAFRRGGADGPRALLAAARRPSSSSSARAPSPAASAPRSLSRRGSRASPFRRASQTAPPRRHRARRHDVLALLLFGGGAAFGALLLRDVLKKPVVRARLFAVFASAPSLRSATRTWGELLVPVLAGALSALAALAALAVLLRDDPRAYVFAAGAPRRGGAGADLLTSGVTAWVWNGVAVLAGRGGPRRLSRPGPAEARGCGLALMKGARRLGRATCWCRVAGLATDVGRLGP